MLHHEYVRQNTPMMGISINWQE